MDVSNLASYHINSAINIVMSNPMCDAVRHVIIVTLSNILTRLNTVVIVLFQYSTNGRLK